MSELSRNFHTSVWQLSFPEKATICVFVGKEDTQKRIIITYVFLQNHYIVSFCNSNFVSIIFLCKQIVDFINF